MRRDGWVSIFPYLFVLYQDKWATVLFVVHFFVFIGISAAGWNNFVAQGNEWSKSQTVNLNNTDSSNSSTTGNVATAPQVNLNMFTSAAITGPIVSTIFAMFGVGFLVTMAYFYMMQRMARRMIQVSLIAQIVLSAVAAVLSLITGATPA